MSRADSQVNPTATQIATRVARIRAAVIKGTVETVTSRQKATGRDPGVRGSTWVSRIRYPRPPEDAIQGVVLHAIKELGDGTEKFQVPEVGEIEAQWIGWRSGVANDEPEVSGTELAKYEGLMRDVTSKVTVFYVYGGAFMLNGPHSGRTVCTSLARLTGGRCYITRYRPAPQNPFPAALLDVLHAYLTLISPPPGAFHAPIAPFSIVLAGDSAGACLVLSLVQVLLSFGRTASLTSSPSIPFYGHSTRLLLPSGLALASPALDQTLGIPSWETNAETDIFTDQLPAITDSQHPCAIWPSNPPRGHPYAEPLTLLHPLVSPCTAKSWKGTPPMWIAMGGGERLLDAAKVVARDAVRGGCKVKWTEWERMPHLWALTCKDWWQGRKAVELWAEACTELVEKGEGLDVAGFMFSLDGEATSIDVDCLTALTRSEMMSGMRKKVEAMKPWTGRKGVGRVTKSQL